MHGASRKITFRAKINYLPGKNKLLTFVFDSDILNKLSGEKAMTVMAR